MSKTSKKISKLVEKPAEKPAEKSAEKPKNDINTRAQLEEIYSSVYAKLKPNQKAILEEVDEKSRIHPGGGLCLPLGYGKSIISLMLGLKYIKNGGEKVIVVVGKTLLGNWECEIKKFFGDKVGYVMFHQDYNKKIYSTFENTEDIKFIFTTPEVLSKAYKEFKISDVYIDKIRVNNGGGRLGQLDNEINFYKVPTVPFLNSNIGLGVLYSINFSLLIVDEAQYYLNSQGKKNQAISSICAKNRWLTSGTLFVEPKVGNILGYHLLINAPKPITYPDTEKLLKSENFPGLKEYIVHRENNEEYVPPDINEYIVSNTMTRKEYNVYKNFKNILNDINKQLKALKRQYGDNGEEIKLYCSYRLVLILYLRQSILCPLIPISSIIVKSVLSEKKNEITAVINKSIEQLDKTWLDNEENAKSSRLKAVLSEIKKYGKENKILIYSNFSSCLDILEYFIKNDKMIIDNFSLFRISGSIAANKRANILKEFEDCEGGILLMTFDIGSAGLNLQFADTVFLMDFWWNTSKAKQAIGRINRPGQTSSINICFFTSNTALENMILKKQSAKETILSNFIRGGKNEAKVPRINYDEIVDTINVAENNKMVLGENAKVVNFS